MKILTYDPKKKKQILAGHYRDGIFVKRVTSKHFMQKFQAYGIQEVVYQRLREEGCKLIVFLAGASTLVSKIADWEKMKVLDFGHGKQRFLPIRYTKRITDEEKIKTLEAYYQGAA